MSASLDWKASIVELAGGRRDNDTKDSMIARAARAAGITYRTAKSLYYRELDDPKFSVAQRIQEALQKRSNAPGRVWTREEKARADVDALQRDLRALADILLQVAPHLQSPALAAQISALADQGRASDGQGNHRRALDGAHLGE